MAGPLVLRAEARNLARWDFTPTSTSVPGSDDSVLILGSLMAFKNVA